MSAAGWTFYTSRLVAPGEMLGEVPLVGLSYTLGENAPLEASASLDLGGDDQSINTELLRRIPEGQSVVYADYHGKIVAAFIVWKHDYRSSNTAMPFVGAGLESYFGKRLCLFTKVYRDTEQVALVRGLIDHAQGQPHGSIGMTVRSLLAAGSTSPKRSRTIQVRDGNFILPEITSMAETGAGFEMDVECTWRANTNIVDRVLRIGYPRLGVDTTTGVDPRLVLSYVRPSASGLGETAPGNVDDWGLPSDGGERATSVLALSTTRDGAQLAQRAAQAPPPGSAVIDTRIVHDDVSKTATLLGHAREELARVSRNTADLTMTCTYGEDAKGEGTEPDRWALYDDVLCRIHDPLKYPLDPDREFYARIVGATVNVDTSTVDFTLRPLRDRAGKPVVL